MSNLTAEIISVGTELLMGQILDTNAQYISQRLAEVGINQYYRTTVGDNRVRLQHTIQQALDRADLVILTGGLGPTEDDLTKETAAAVLGYTEFSIDEASKARMYQRFVHYNHAMPENNLKQVMFPKGAIILPNDYGTAPGCILEKDGKAIILLPGPPREMRPMFDASVMPYLCRESHSQLYSQVLRVYGMGESMVADQLGDMIQRQTNPTIATYALTGETTIPGDGPLQQRPGGGCAITAGGTANTKPAGQRGLRPPWGTVGTGLRRFAGKGGQDPGCSGKLFWRDAGFYPCFCSWEFRLVFRGLRYLFQCRQDAAVGGKRKDPGKPWGRQPGNRPGNGPGHAAKRRRRPGFGHHRDRGT